MNELEKCKNDLITSTSENSSLKDEISNLKADLKNEKNLIQVEKDRHVQNQVNIFIKIHFSVITYELLLFNRLNLMRN